MTETASLVIKVDSSGARTATRDLDALGKQGKQTEGAVAGLTRAFVALGGAYAVGAGIRAVINATIESQKAQAQLAAVLKSTGQAAGLTQIELNKMADSLQRVTTYDDEAITGAQSLLLTFTNIGRDVFPSATEAVLNMSTALGQDLKSSATQLGKALQDPIDGITALRRVGVAFTDAQKDVIEKLVETGNVAEAQRLILKELQVEFGGSAEAARNTLGGALQALKNDFGNLLEGDGGGKGVKGATAALNDLGETMRSEEMKQGFAVMVNGLTAIIGKSLEATAAVAGLLSKMGAIPFSGGVPIGEQSAGTLDLRKTSLSGELGRVAGGDIAQSRQLRGLQTREQLLAAIRADIAAVEQELARRQLGQSGMLGRGRNRQPSTVSAPVLPGVDPAGGGSAAVASIQQIPEYTLRATQGISEFTRALQDMRAEMEGPVAEINLEYARKQEEIRELFAETKLGAEDLEEALLLLEQQRLADVRAIEQQATATKDFLKEIPEAQLAATQAMDNFKYSFEDNFAAVLAGTQSVGDAFGSMVDMIIQQLARAAAAWATNALFGGGGAGGGLLSMIGSLFGGGGGGNVLGGFSNSGFGGDISGKNFGKFAKGTTFSPGGMAIVGEEGPELIPLSPGSRVIPNHQLGGGKTTINVNVAPSMENRTAQQVAVRVAEMHRLAMARA